MQPGWTAEANGILHPRESEYETQFVVNGFPEYDNRSPAFAPTIEADLIESVKVFTGGIPAEFGQKVGGVVEVNTKQNSSPGFHGTAVAQGGSFNTVGGFLSGQYTAGRTTASAAAQGFLTDRYLDPPVTENYSNHASNTSFTAALERDFSDSNHLRLSAAHRQTRFQVPNDLLQQAAGQRQDRTSGDSEGTVSYQHIFSSALVGAVRGKVRDVGAQLWSNPLSTPILAHQDRGFHEGYLNANLAGQWRRHDWKTGVEARFASVREEFGYHIAAYGDNSDSYRFFDRDLPTNYEYTGHSPDREQAAYAQDTIRLGNFTASIGLRFDRYALLVKETGWSPRLGVSWNVQPLGLVLHASYDRTFGTPPFENILVSAAPTTRFDQGLYLPVRPSRGNYYEGGLTQALGKRVRLDASYFHRSIRNFQDDDLLLNTGVGFPDYVSACDGSRNGSETFGAALGAILGLFELCQYNWNCSISYLRRLVS
jgi:outer membrane cobalamin receptor